MSDCVANNVNGNVGLAFGIVTAAGLSTTIGAALAFVMPYSRSSKNLFLAFCLSVAAGVMIYVSFVEIFTGKAVGEFEKCVPKGKENLAYLYATLCFFGGIAITAAFDLVLHSLQHRSGLKEQVNGKTKGSGSNDNNNKPKAINEDKQLPSSSEDDTSRDQAPDLEQQMAGNTNVNDGNPDASLGEPVHIDQVVGHGGHLIASMYNQDAHEHDSSALIRMGIFAGIALAFHNFPEGLATYVAVLEDPKVGASVAIAIAIHNIPEGVCVAMPIFYATGSRLKAFFWATLSGMTELVGALLGLIILRSVITPTVYAILFGIVAGMMVYISFKELVPTAHRYDPDDQVTSIGIVIGMLVMAISLVLFQF